MSRILRWYWLLQMSIVGSMPLMVGYGQCPSAVQIETQIDSIKQQVGGNSVQQLTKIRQQLVQNQCPRDSMFARVTMQLGYASFMQGDADLAVALFNQSIVLFRQQITQQSVRLVAAYFYLGQAYQGRNDDAAAQLAYLACIRLGGTNPVHDKMVGYALSGQALLCYKKGDYEAGLTFAGQAISRAQRCHDEQLEARCLNETARNLLQTGRFAQALTYIDRAAALVKADHNLVEDQNVYTLFRAQALVGLHRYPAALTLFTRLIRYYQRTNQPERMANVCGDLGDLYSLKLNQSDRALTYYWRAHRAFLDPYEKSRMLQSVGNVLQQTGQCQGALRTYQQALRTLPIQFQQDDPRTNPTAEAIRLSTYKEYLLTLIWDKADTWLDYAKAGGQPRQKLEQALQTYRVADQMVDRMRWQQSGQQSKLYWRQRTHVLYEHALETCYRLGNAEQAFYFFEKSRAVLLADKLNELGASQLLSPQQQATELRLRQTLDRQLAALHQLRPNSTAYIQAKTKLSVAQEQVDTFVRQLELSNPAYYRYKYDNHVASLAELTDYLNERKAAFVTYFVGDSALYSLCVQGAKTHLVRQPLASYRQDLRAYLDLLSQPQQLNRSFPSFLTLGRSLYARLLAPLAVAPGRVIVSPDGPFIPFETLSRSDGEPAYALNDYALSYAYSARLLVRPGTLMVNRWGTGDFLGVAPVHFGTSLKQASLPGSGEVVRTISEQFASTRLLLNDDATRQAFKHESPAYRIVHLFTHAAGGQEGEEPRLFFADSTLPLSKLATDKLTSTQLVTLAACETGTGIDQQGEGVFSLARGFAALGVPSILTTLWRVPNEATYQISSLFYKNLANGISKDVALQRARQEWLRQADGLDQLPSTWAGLILVGNAEPLQTGSPNTLLGGLSGLAVTGIALLGWRRWRRNRPVNTRPIEG